MTPTTTPPDRIRLTRRATALAVGVALIAAGALAATPADAADRSFSSGTRIDIVDHLGVTSRFDKIAVPTEGHADLYPSTAPLAEVGGRITDVDLQLNNIMHTFPDDLDVMLVGPGGQKAVVLSDIGGTADLTAQNNATLTLDDEAGSSLSDSGQIVSGRFRPTDVDEGGSLDPFPAPAPAPGDAGSALSVFDGTDPNGAWNLYVTDDAAGDSGSIQGFRLIITTDAVSAPYPSTIEVAGSTGPVTDVDVTLHGFRHEFASDVDLVLVGPHGQQSTLMSDVGRGNNLPPVEVTFDDEATATLVSSEDITEGRFRPVDDDGAEQPGTDSFPAPGPDPTLAVPTLSVFDGTGADGTWRLFAVDNFAGDDGEIAGGWTLTLTTADPAPTTTTPTPSTTPPPAGTTAPQATDTLAPRVGAVAPRGGSTRVARGRDVTVSFTEPVRRSTLTRTSVHLLRKGSGHPVPATLTYAAGSRTATLDPARRLRPGTTYRIVVTAAVRDLAGNRLDQGPAAGLQQLVRRFSTR